MRGSQTKESRIAAGVVIATARGKAFQGIAAEFVEDAYNKEIEEDRGLGADLRVGHCVRYAWPRKHATDGDVSSCGLRQGGFRSSWALYARAGRR